MIVDFEVASLYYYTIFNLSTFKLNGDIRIIVMKRTSLDVICKEKCWHKPDTSDKSELTIK